MRILTCGATPDRRHAFYKRCARRNQYFEGFAPDSGQLSILGANGSRAVVKATGGGTATISIDSKGDGDFTDSGDRVINGQWTTFFG